MAQGKIYAWPFTAADRGNRIVKVTKIVVIASYFSGFVLLSLPVASIADSSVAQEAAAYKDIVRMKVSLLGRWVGETQTPGAKNGEILTSGLERTVSRGPLPHTFVIEGVNSLPDGSRVAGYEMMGVRADGAVIRQLLLVENRSIFKQEFILDYAIRDDTSWTLQMLESLDGGKGSDGPGLLYVSFERKGDTWMVTKSAVGASGDRPWVSKTIMLRQSDL